MTTDNRKGESSTQQPQKPQNEPVVDLPIPAQSQQDAQEVKGGFGKKREA